MGLSHIFLSFCLSLLSVLQSWCVAHRIYHSKVRYGAATSESSGQGLYACERIDKGEEFISVPIGACITENIAKESDIGRIITEENREREQIRLDATAAASTATAINHTSNGLSSMNSIPHRISARSLFYCYLIWARHCSTSPYREWLVHGVPRNYDLPICWGNSRELEAEDNVEIQALKGTNLGEAVPHRLGQLHRKYASCIPSLIRRAPELFRSDIFTFENWMWAHCTYSSRGFPAQLVDPTAAATATSVLPGALTNPAAISDASHPSLSIPATASSASSSISSSSRRPQQLGCLIPYFDLTNHRSMQPITWLNNPIHPSLVAAITNQSAIPAIDDTLLHPHERILRAAERNSNAATIPLEARVSLRAGEVIESGSEIYNNYGFKSNEEFLMGYGFTLEGINQADEVTLALGAKAVSTQPHKLAILSAAGLQLHQRVKRGRVPESLIQLMRAVVGMDEQYIQECSAAWIPYAVPHLSNWISSISSISTGSTSATLIERLSLPCHRTELTMLHTLRSLLIGRLKRLQMYDANSYASIPDEFTAVMDDHSSSSSRCTVRALSPAFFTRFAAADAATLKTSISYHLRCALNYRIGQREILMDAVYDIDRRIEIEAKEAAAVMLMASNSLYVVPPMPSTSSAVTPLPDASAAVQTRKKRKTGNVTSAITSSDAVATAPTHAELLQIYYAWLSTIGAQVNGEWKNGFWQLRDPCNIPLVASTTTSAENADFVSSPLILSFPLSSLLSMTSLTSSDSFSPCADMVGGLQAEQLMILFLLHERSKGKDSHWAAWIDIAAMQQPTVHYSTNGSEEFNPDTLLPAEQALYELYVQLFPALTDADAQLWPMEHYSWSRVVWSASIIQTHHIQWLDKGDGVHVTPSTISALLPVPSMPVPVTFPISTIDVVQMQKSQEQQQEEQSAMARGSKGSKRKSNKRSESSVVRVSPSSVIVIRSLISLPVGSTPSLSSPIAPEWPNLVSHSNQLLLPTPIPNGQAVPSLSDSFDSLPLSCASMIQMHEELLSSQQQRMTDLDSQVLPCGLPVYNLTRAHQELWSRLGIDETSHFIRTEKLPISPLLLNVVRSFFLSRKQLHAAVSTSDSISSSANINESSLTGVLVDDSDEEEDDENTTKSIHQRMEADPAAENSEDEEDEEDEESMSDDLSVLSESALHTAAIRFLIQLHQREMNSFEQEENELEMNHSVSSFTPTIHTASSIPVVHSSAQLMHYSWRQHRRRLLLAVKPTETVASSLL
jgi:hypothetical protein